MAIQLKDFFDLDKVIFTKEELELPYTKSFSKVNDVDDNVIKDSKITCK